MNDAHARPEDRNRTPVGTRRTLRVLLDPAQYHADVLAGKTKAAAAGEGAAGDAAADDPAAEYIYRTFNLLVRRRGEENNFKAVLATIRDGEGGVAGGGAGAPRRGRGGPRDAGSV